MMSSSRVCCNNEQQLIAGANLASTSTKTSFLQQHDEGGSQAREKLVEVHLDMRSQMTKNCSESVNCKSQIEESYSNGVTNESVLETENEEHLNDEFKIKNLKLFENLEETFNTSTVQKPALESFVYSGSCPSDSNETSEYKRDNNWVSNYESNSFIKCTGYQLTPPMSNPVDMTVDGDVLAIADYDNGIHFINNKQCVRRHFNTMPYRICGVQFWHDDRDSQHVIMLSYMTEREKWTINVHSWPNFNKELVFECPTQPSCPSWARRKITLVNGILYLLATSEHCSAIWTLQMAASVWKTLLVERGRPQSNVGFNFANSLLVGGTAANRSSASSVYSDFDVHRWSKAECRIVLCEAQKSQLNILILFEPNQLVDKQTIKVKRRKNEKWIVQGPKLAVWDSERDIVVYDGSGKIFWFDGTNYRIRKIVGDIGRSEVCALEAKNGWCYVLCRHQLCVHAFLYRPPSQ